VSTLETLQQCIDKYAAITGVFGFGYMVLSLAQQENVVEA